MDIDINQYLSIFVEESKEHLQIMNDVMLELEKNPSNLEYINEIFRVAHTLKGMSGTMGFKNMAELTHEMENLLQAVRAEEIKLTAEVIDVLFECFDELELYVEHIINEGNEISSKNITLINKILSLLNKDAFPESCNEVDKEIDSHLNIDEFVLNLVKKARERDLNVYQISFVLEESCMLKAARAFIIFKALEDKGEVIYSEPSVENIEDEKFDREFAILYISNKKLDVLKKLLVGISELELVEIIEFDESNYRLRNAGDIEEEIVGPSKLEERQVETSIPKIRKTVRVDIDRLDNLMNLVSELIIIKTRMDDLFTEEHTKNNISETVEYLDRITSNIHDAVMKVRMVPIERVFNRFPRLVRDVSKELNKEIDLEMSGEDTEVDRTIVDEIGDPLIHLIRNSLDHGIELPEERLARGKNKLGKVGLKAYPDGNNVVIEVYDDGAGIDPEIIKAKSVEKGIASEEDILNMDDNEAVMLLFEAGLSTSEEVSDVSGRGVGLDVVRTKIESINGSIEVDTKIGEGSNFIIRIPLTLAIIQALMIKLGDEVYAIPLSSVTEITNIEKNLVNNIQGQEVVVYRGVTVPIIRLGAVLNVENIENDEEHYLVVIVNKGDRQAGIIVDELIVQQEIVIKSLGSYLDNIDYISGATILGDGSISLIVDINSLI